MKFEWKRINDEQEDAIGFTEKAKVAGGWLVRTYDTACFDNALHTHISALSMVFLPDPNHEWEVE